MYEQSAIDVLFLEGKLEEAAAKYYEAARNGSPRCAFNYGYCLLRGRGVKTDYKRAAEYFAYAKNQKGGEAEYNLALMAMHGYGMSRDFKRAIAYMRESAELGCVEAQLYLGMAYTLGAVFEPEISAICLIPYHKAEYIPDDEFLLGGAVDMEAEEEARMSVISSDDREAFEWFRMAAHSDPTYAEDLVARGQFMYAKCYLDGFGTHYDRTKGARLMLLAGKNGSREAVEYLEANGHITQLLLEEKKEKRTR